jgi:hypothetical protein
MSPRRCFPVSETITTLGAWGIGTTGLEIPDDGSGPCAPAGEREQTEPLGPRLRGGPRPRLVRR